MDDRSQDAPPYRHVAWCYDALASVYSLGAIDRAKCLHHNMIESDDRVLYAGAGRGKEINEACHRGAEVTCIEPCSAMASRLHTRLSKIADGFTIIPKPIQSMHAQPVYDLVIAHFFLNVFDPQTMPGVLCQLSEFVKPGGMLIIADFKPSPPDASTLDRLFRWAYYKPLNLMGWLLRICARHPIYDYQPPLREHGFKIESTHQYTACPLGIELYEVIVARRE